MDSRIEQIRKAEASSHIEAYTNHALFSTGSWLAKPVKTVIDLLPRFEGYDFFRALDLGSGVGRNSIPVAQHFKDVPCRVDCVDILDLAIEKLQENAQRHGVAESISGVISPIDDYEIETERYDLIMAISALEHIESHVAFEKKLAEIRAGLRIGGIACLIVNSGVTEHDKATGKEIPPQFEVNLPPNELQHLLEQTFAGWQIIKHTIVHQKYDIPRECGLAELETDVVTYIVRKGTAMTFIETDRLLLRNVESKDADIMYDYRNNEICARYQRGQTKDYEGIAQLVERRKDDVISVDTPFMAAVALKDTDEMVGEIVVMPNDGTISLGYTFSYKHHRKGYAFEALTALINMLHARYPEWDFISFTEPENMPSMALLKKLGYKDMGYIPSMESQVFGKWTTPATEAEIAQAVNRN